MKNYLLQFGGSANDEHIKQYQQSENWRNGKFQNLEDTNMSINFWEIPEIIYKQIVHKEGKEPKEYLPIAPFDQPLFLADPGPSKFIWYGHSVLLFRINQKTILIDPMLGPDAAPIAPTSAQRFSKNTLDLIDDFPEIDLMIISHDHYDHLDFASIQKLKTKTKAYYVALGVKRHLVKWGISPDIITEFDWWENRNYHQIEITFTPSRHFSGRGLTDRAKSLWGGWIFKTKNENIWFSGDGGFGKHFEEIGKKFGPFDLAFMECGQYNDKWRMIHMFPEESTQAATIAGVKKAIPVHWGSFSLSFQHTWYEPADEFDKYAKQNGLETLYPPLGEIFTINSSTNKKWWDMFNP